MMSLINMNFKEIIQTTRNYNFHSHTQFCDGHAPMETMARSAVELGFTHYGFSPHSPIPIESPCNMSRNDVEAYFAEYNRIKNIPELASCNFYVAMEVDFLGPEWGPCNDFFKALPLDYTIGSVHFIPTQDGEYVDIDGNYDAFRKRLSERFRGDIEYVVDTFFAQSRAMLTQGNFDIFGHFDKIGNNAGHVAPGIEESSFYQTLANDLTDRIIESGVVVELNTKAYLKYGRFFPSQRLIKRLIDGGTTILVNSDAHDPALINAGRIEAFNILDSYKYGS